MGSDRSELATVTKEAKTALQTEKLEVVAERGYFKGEEILACEEAAMTVTLPKPMTSGAKSEGRFGKQDFVYCLARMSSRPRWPESHQALFKIEKPLISENDRASPPRRSRDASTQSIIAQPIPTADNCCTSRMQEDRRYCFYGHWHYASLNTLLNRPTCRNLNSLRTTAGSRTLPAAGRHSAPTPSGRNWQTVPVRSERFLHPRA